ncbi:class I SAM-dependent methyltransferase [Cohnella sp. AR92]|uniref:class I SAM-dependent methyltransferase n=1 Tax=Cohnella sp. AR92 TaxID=648716 RepID=UPI0013150E17|nr:class I SAM-dependent methyltransferase [Cohnella sp. AR92]
MTLREEPQPANERDRISRYMLQTDPSAETGPLALPPAWWSKPYEYEWARRFARPGDIVLEAGGGSVQPFILKLASLCREVHVCDDSPHAESTESIIREWIVRYGPVVAVELQGPAFERISFACADLSALPFDEGTFDAVFYLPSADRGADGKAGLAEGKSGASDREERTRIWREFARVLKPQGRLIAALGVTGSLDGFASEIAAAGLRFDGPAELERPADALYAVRYGERHYCFRACLVRAEGCG